MKTMQDQIFELLEDAGMNWSVNKEPLTLQSDQKETRFFGVVRSDNRNCFGTCTGRYEVFQNQEMAELAIRLQEETGYNPNGGNVFAEGARVMIDLKGKNEILEYPKVGDIMEKSIRITNTHDGTGSLRLAMGSLVLSCTNGMTRWVAHKETSIRHTTNMRHMVKAALKGFEIIQEEEKTFMDEIRRMIDKPISEQKVAQMINEITEIEVEKVNTTHAVWSSDQYSTRAINKARSLFDSIKEEIDYKGSNVWGLLNGVTHYTTHKGGRENTRQDSKVFGGLMRTDKKAYDLALQML